MKNLTMLLLCCIPLLAGADACKDGTLGDYCEVRSDCQADLTCEQVTFLGSSTACTTDCAPSTGDNNATFCHNNEGVCVEMNGPDGLLPWCMSKCRPSGGCTWGLAQYYKGACFCAPGVFQ